MYSPIVKAQVEHRKCKNFLKKNLVEEAIYCLNKSIDELQSALKKIESDVIKTAIIDQIEYTERKIILLNKSVEHNYLTNCKDMSLNNENPFSFEEMQLLVNKISCDNDLLLGKLFLLLNGQNDSQNFLETNLSNESNDHRKGDALSTVEKLVANNQLLKEHVFSLLNELKETKNQNITFKHELMNKSSLIKTLNSQQPSNIGHTALENSQHFSDQSSQNQSESNFSEYQKDPAKVEDNKFLFFKEPSSITTILPPLELPKFDINYMN